MEDRVHAWSRFLRATALACLLAGTLCGGLGYFFGGRLFDLLDDRPGLHPALRGGAAEEVEVVWQEQRVQLVELEASTSFVVFPADCNANPPACFGGKLLAEMDRCAAIAVRRCLRASPAGARDAVTVAVDGVQFHRPARVKDLVVVTARVSAVGARSLTVDVRAECDAEDGRQLLVGGKFVFVAYDVEKGKAVEHRLQLPPVPQRD